MAKLKWSELGVVIESAISTANDYIVGLFGGANARISFEELDKRWAGVDDIQAATNGILYYWIDIAARNAQAGMATDELGMMTDTTQNRTDNEAGFVYKYSGAAWVYLYTIPVTSNDNPLPDGGPGTSELVSRSDHYHATVYNPIKNPNFGVVQRGTSFTSATTPANSDDTYLIDQWILLSDGNDIVDVTQQTGGGVDGQSSYIRLDVETVAKKFGLLHIIQNKDSKYLVGNTGSLSFDCKVTDITKLSDIRAVLVSWDGTADTVTSDIISAWGAEGVKPTLVANWTEENVSADLGVTAAWARYKIENISIDTASTKNIGVFFYQNNVATNDTAGIFLEITNVLLNQGLVSMPFVPRPYAEELDLCQWRFERLLPGATNVFAGAGAFLTGVRAVIYVKFAARKGSLPTSNLSNNSDWNLRTVAGQQPITSVTGITSGFDSLTLDATYTGAATTAGFGTTLISANASAFIDISAEL